MGILPLDCYLRDTEPNNYMRFSVLMAGTMRLCLIDIVMDNLTRDNLVSEVITALNTAQLKTAYENGADAGTPVSQDGRGRDR